VVEGVRRDGEVEAKVEVKKIRKLKCPVCGYTWIPRIPKPKCCPRCRTYAVFEEIYEEVRE